MWLAEVQVHLAAQSGEKVWWFCEPQWDPDCMCSVNKQPALRKTSGFNCDWADKTNSLAGELFVWIKIWTVEGLSEGKVHFYSFLPQKHLNNRWMDCQDILIPRGWMTDLILWRPWTPLWDSPSLFLIVSATVGLILMKNIMWQWSWPLTSETSVWNFVIISASILELWQKNC